MAGLLLTVLPAAARAQENTDDPFRAALRAEIDATLPRLSLASRRARWEAAFHDSVASAQRPPVPSHLEAAVGPLHVIASPERLDEARRRVGRLWEDVRPVVEGLAPGTAPFEDAVLVFDPDGVLDGVDEERLVYHLDGRSWSGLLFRDRQLSLQILHAIGAEMEKEVRQPIRQWAYLPLVVQPTDEPQLAHLHRLLAGTGAPSTEGCLAGDDEACWAVLGLHPTDNPIPLWITPAALGGATSTSARDLRLRRWRVCAPGADDPGACRGMLRSGSWLTMVPGPTALRADLVRFALREGGEGAARRLRSTWPAVPTGGDDPLRDYRVFATAVRRGLVAASGMGESALISAWRERLLAAEPELRAGSERVRFATFLWILFFAAFATRSTRWRLG